MTRSERQMPEEQDSRYQFLATERVDHETGLNLIRLESIDTKDPTRSLVVDIAPEKGSNIVTFNSGPNKIFERKNEHLMYDGWTGCFVIGTPANRVDWEGQKAINLNGEIKALDQRERLQGNTPLVHGLVDDLPWKFKNINTDGQSARVSTYIDMNPSNPHWEFLPLEHRMGLDFKLDSKGLTVKFKIENKSGEKLPFNAALHPYYSSDGAEVQIDAEGHMPTDSELLPLGNVNDVTGTKYDLRKPTPVSATFFDDVWTRLRSGNGTFIQWPEKGIKVRQIVNPKLASHVVFFSQRQESDHTVCLEPQWGSTNAINLARKADEIEKTDPEKAAQLREAANLTEIPPGETREYPITFQVEHFEPVSS